MRRRHPFPDFTARGPVLCPDCLRKPVRIPPAELLQTFPTGLPPAIASSSQSSAGPDPVLSSLMGLSPGLIWTPKTFLCPTW